MGISLSEEEQGLPVEVVLAADREGAYSHTGILKKKAGQWYVIHAVPGEPDFKDDPDRVKMETVKVFFEKRKAVNGAIMRVSGDSVARYRAATHAEHLFCLLGQGSPASFYAGGRRAVRAQNKENSASGRRRFPMKYPADARQKRPESTEKSR